ncbi:MAG: hypothetical protein QXU40_00965 [Candidatus Pacearchaeota archaeon]
MEQKEQKNYGEKRKTKVIIQKIILSLLMIIALLSSISALGVSPARIVENFEPNLEKTVTLKVINNERNDFRASIYLRGELSEYITLNQKEISFRANEESKEISYVIKLPAKIEEPGTHRADIVIREIRSGEERGDITIGSLVAVVSQLHIEVPYPGKYIKANLDVIEAKEGEEAKFFIQVNNLGTENIENLKARIFILSGEEKIAEIETDRKSVRTKERVELSGTWLVSTSSGIYKAVAVIDYDGNTLKVEKEFLVGDFFVKLLDVSVKNFRLGDVAKFNILVENIGNLELKNLYSRIILKDLYDNELMNYKTEETTLEPLSRKELFAYWDTENVEKGRYEGEIEISYEGKSIRRGLRAEVLDNAINIEVVGITAHVVASRGGVGGNVNTLLVIVIIMLVLANLLWFLYFKRKRK